MDFSPTYKTMCLNAHEIQKKWKPAKGDIYLIPQEKDGSIHFWTEETGPAVFRQGFAILKTEKVVTLEQRIWLPRHGQLMELAQLPGITFQDMAYRFHDWTKAKGEKLQKMSDKKSSSIPSSMEEAWLVFVMETLFEKFWDGEDWISIE